MSASPDTLSRTLEKGGSVPMLQLPQKNGACLRKLRLLSFKLPIRARATWIHLNP
jgi:hypothetical protein